MATPLTARDAFVVKNPSLSAALHDSRLAIVRENKEDHGSCGSDYVKSIVFGGLDGKHAIFLFLFHILFLIIVWFHFL
jgi:hypothetical protein